MISRAGTVVMMLMTMMLCRAGAGLISSLSAPSPPPALRYSLRKGRLHKPFPRPPRPRTWWHKSWLSRYWPQTTSLSTPTSNIVIMMIIMVEMVVLLLRKLHPRPFVFFSLHIILFSSSHSFWKYTGCLKKWVLPNWAFGDPAASWKDILMIFFANLQMLNSVKLNFLRHPVYIMTILSR